jgi:hypothetical protein
MLHAPPPWEPFSPSMKEPKGLCIYEPALRPTRLHPSPPNASSSALTPFLTTSFRVVGSATVVARSFSSLLPKLVCQESGA